MLKGHSLAQQYRRHLQGHQLAVSFMTVAELYEWGFHAHWGKARFARLAALLTGLDIIPSSTDVRVHEAQGHRLLPATAAFAEPGLETFEFLVIPEISALADEVIELGPRRPHVADDGAVLGSTPAWFSPPGVAMFGS